MQAIAAIVESGGSSGVVLELKKDFLLKNSERFFLGEPMNHLADEFDNMSERAIALLGAAILDEALGEVIKLKLLDEKDIVKNQFGGQGALATFSAKIDIARLLAIYSKDAWSDLHIIRKIRNDAAHSTRKFSFSASPTKERAQSIKLAETYLHDVTSDTPDDIPALFVYGIDQVLAEPMLRYLGTTLFIAWQFKGYGMQSPNLRPTSPWRGI